MKEYNKLFNSIAASGMLLIWAVLNFGVILMGFMLNLLKMSNFEYITKIFFIIIIVSTPLMILYFICYVLYHIFKKD